MGEITFDDFLKVDIRVGRVTRAEPFPRGAQAGDQALDRLRAGDRRAEVLGADRRATTRPEALVGRLVLAVVNFPPRQIGPLRSEVLTLGVADAAGAGGAGRARPGRAARRAAALMARPADRRHPPAAGGGRGAARGRPSTPSSIPTTRRSPGGAGRGDARGGRAPLRGDRPGRRGRDRRPRGGGCGIVANFGVGVNNIDLAAAQGGGGRRHQHAGRADRRDRRPRDRADAGGDAADERDRGDPARAAAGTAWRRPAGSGWGCRARRSASSAWGGSARRPRGGRRSASGCGSSTSTARPSGPSTFRPRPLASIEAVLAEADVVSLHVPGGGGNRGLISAERLAAMKPGAYLVNTARGDVVDEAALAEALAVGAARRRRARRLRRGAEGAGGAAGAART